MNDLVSMDQVEALAKNATEKAIRIVHLKALLDFNKPLYEELDKLTLELKDIVGTNEVQIALTDTQRMIVHNGEVKFLAPNQIVRIVDNFAEKNVVFKTAGVKRFEAFSETFEEYVANQVKPAKIAKKK